MSKSKDEKPKQPSKPKQPRKPRAKTIANDLHLLPKEGSEEAWLAQQIFNELMCKKGNLNHANISSKCITLLQRDINGLLTQPEHLYKSLGLTKAEFQAFTQTCQNWAGIERVLVMNRGKQLQKCLGKISNSKHPTLVLQALKLYGEETVATQEVEEQNSLERLLQRLQPPTGE